MEVTVSVKPVDLPKSRRLPLAKEAGIRYDVRDASKRSRGAYTALEVMQMRIMERPKHSALIKRSQTPQIVGLALFFVLGALGGHFYAAYCCSATTDVLTDFLSGYLKLFEGGSETAVSFLSVARLYFGYAAAAFLLGFTGIGVLALPALSAVYGFSVMFAISCFAGVYGKNGVLLALAALGVRLLFTLPPFLWTASYAWAMSLSAVPSLRGKHAAPVSLNAAYWYRLAVAAVWTAVGMGCEVYLTPALFQMALGQLSLLS